MLPRLGTVFDPEQRQDEVHRLVGKKYTGEHQTRDGLLQLFKRMV